MANMVTVAKKYLKLGWNVFPIQKNKKPYFEWKKGELNLQTTKVTEEMIDEWWKKYPKAQIATVTGTISNLMVIDVDELAEANESLFPLIPQDIKYPISVTQSGGLHLFFQCPNGRLSNNTRVIKGCDLRANGGYVVLPPSKGEDGSYLWEDRPSITPIPMPPQPYLDALDKTKKKSKDKAREMYDDGTRDVDLFYLANTLYRGKMKEDEMYQTLMAMAAQCNPPFDPAVAEEKVRNVIKTAIEKQHDWKVEVEQWVDGTVGYFRIQDCFSELGAMSTKDKNHIRVILHRLVKSGMVEHHKNENGKYRKLDQKREYLDFMQATSQSLPIKFPFELESLVRIYPKDIILVAGEPNAGKTTFSLNMVKLNMNEYPVNYYTCEMSASALRTKLELFGDVPLSTWNFKAEDRSYNFADVIEPDGFNVIDYLEIHNEHYKIGQWIKDIHVKLRNGIAVICIQKKKGAPEGVGGMATLQKPNLYLNIGGSRLTIVKCKNFKDSTLNPNGMTTKFKLIGGSTFRQDGEWEYE